MREALPFVMAAGFSLMWCGVVCLMSALGGWSKLARTWISDHEPYGEWFRWRSVSIGSLTDYSNAINVHLSSEGVLLVPALAFRLGHPPILLPWHTFVSLSVPGFFKMKGQLVLEMLVEGTRIRIYLPSSAQFWVDRYGYRRLGVKVDLAKSAESGPIRTGVSA